MNWEMILAIVVFLGGLILAGYVKKFKKEIEELVAAINILINTFQSAMADKSITDAERADLITKLENVKSEYSDVANLAIEVANAWAHRGKP